MNAYAGQYVSKMMFLPTAKAANNLGNGYRELCCPAHELAMIASCATAET